MPVTFNDHSISSLSFLDNRPNPFDEENVHMKRVLQLLYCQSLLEFEVKLQFLATSFVD